MLPLNEWHREDIAKVRGEIWDLYRGLKTYKAQPGSDQKAALETFLTRFLRSEHVMSL